MYGFWNMKSEHEYFRLIKAIGYNNSVSLNVDAVIYSFLKQHAAASVLSDMKVKNPGEETTTNLHRYS